ncbi:MAG: TonB family protein [Methylophilaceae bacterium]|nr:TonB family protein [Methylophilaceae bacterium]
MPKVDHRLNLMIAASVAVHAALILGLKFSPPDPRKAKDDSPALEIILVNAKSPTRPDKADALAQTNLNRGGNTDANRRMKSALPVPKSRLKQPASKPTAEVRQAEARVAELELETARREQQVKELEQRVQQAMTQLEAQRSIPQEPAPTTTPQPLPKASDLIAQSLQAARLEAEIAKEHEAYQKRPKRKYIGARVQEYRFAAYVESWRQKVEKIGNLNYPEEARAKKIYGQLRMTVSIRADGTVEDIVIDQSSGHKVLDDAARRIVELAAPYAAFSEDMRKDTDILSITRTWTFTREDTLSSN